MDARIFGKNLKAFRNAKGWTQAELGLKMGLDASVICNLENGKRKWCTKYNDRLASVLGVTAEQLASGQISNEPLASGLHIALDEGRYPLSAKRPLSDSRRMVVKRKKRRKREKRRDAQIKALMQTVNELATTVKLMLIKGLGGLTNCFSVAY